MWTSFLKARLVCGFPEESLYFNRLQDIYVMPAEDWHNTTIYALFTSSWLDTSPSFLLSATKQHTERVAENGSHLKLKAQHFEMFSHTETKLNLACRF